MRDFRPSEVRPVVEIQRLTRESSAQHLAEAAETENRAAEAAKAAEAEAVAAFERWQACLSAHTFDPLALGAFAQDLSDRDASLSLRRFDEQRARDRTNDARLRLAEAEVRVSQAEKMLKSADRRRRRDLEERRQEALEDRTSYRVVNS